MLVKNVTKGYHWQTTSINPNKICCLVSNNSPQNCLLTASFINYFKTRALFCNFENFHSFLCSTNSSCCRSNSKFCPISKQNTRPSISYQSRCSQAQFRGFYQGNILVMWSIGDRGFLTDMIKREMTLSM